MTIEIQVLYLLLAATALLAGASGIVILRFQRQVMNSAAFWNSPTGAAVQAGTCDGAAGQERLEGQLAELRQMLETLANRQRTEPAPAVSEARFENAVLLARQGASLHDLTQCCGLSSGEAQLLMRLHGPRTVLVDAA